MNKFINSARKGAWCATALVGILMQTAAVNAGEVTLKSSDGTVNIVGEFIEFKDDNYVVRTALGDLRVSASRVRCEGADCPTFDTTKSDVTFIGSYTVGLGIMPLLLSGYAAHLDAEINIENTQTEDEFLAGFISENGYGEEIGSFLVTSMASGAGFAKFASFASTDSAITMASRRIKPKEARALRDAGKGNMISVGQEHIIAIDSLVVIVNPENGLESISITDLQSIFSGAITNWNQLGGADLPIQVIAHHEESGTRSVFDGRIFGKDKPATPESTVIGESNSAIAAMVNEQPGAIGYVGQAFTRGAKALSLVNECGITTSPDPFSVKTEEYDLERRLFLYNAKNPDAKIKDFIEFATSPEADGVIEKSGFISLGVSRREQSMTSHRANALLSAEVDAFESNVIREMLSEMVKSDRLSSTFRFRSGSSRLDERGALEMERLAGYLKELPEGTNVTMVGFTDDVGAFVPNRKLSIARAQQVVDLIKHTAADQLAHINFSAIGFGEISPSGCNTSIKGRGINRRVEVWITK